MDKNGSRFFAGLTVAALSLVGTTALAHEDRDLGQGYSIAVGFNNEEPPNPYAGGANGLDFYPFYESPLGSGNFVSLDTALGDKVEICAISIIVKSESWGAPIVKKIRLNGPFTRTIGEEGFIDYVKSFTPPSAGFYGFIVSGELKKKGEQKVEFEEKFVCGEGSLDRDSDGNVVSNFECVGPHP